MYFLLLPKLTYATNKLTHSIHFRGNSLHKRASLVRLCTLRSRLNKTVSNSCNAHTHPRAVLMKHFHQNFKFINTYPMKVFTSVIDFIEK